MKNRIIVLLSLIMGLSIGAYAQNKKAYDKEKMKEYKIRFVSDYLNLNDKEKNNFETVYREYIEELDQIRENYKNGRRSKDETADESDIEIEKRLDERIARKEEEIAIDKKYLASFKKILPMQKVGQIYQAERAFKTELLEKLKNYRRGDNDNVNE